MYFLTSISSSVHRGKISKAEQRHTNWQMTAGDTIKTGKNSMTLGNEKKHWGKYI